MRLMFVARAIDRMAGGVERMIIALMNEMVRRGHEVDLFTWDQEQATAFYAMAKEIAWSRLNDGNPYVAADRMTKIRRLGAVRTLIRRSAPQAIVCFQEGPYLAIRAYTAGMGIPVIAAERNAPTHFDFTTASRRQWITYNAFRFAARILVQCESYKELYPEYLRSKIVTISNPVFQAERQSRPESSIDGRFRILSVGRLSYQKNYAALINAFAGLAHDFPQWDLTLVGEGEERTELEEIVRAHGISDRVTFAGITTTVANYYLHSNLFCLSSFWEGFPNALAEALAHGLPSVGYADCAGVRDLISHGENGLLAAGNGNVGTLKDALQTLMSSDELRAVIGANAARSVRRYEPSEIFNLWEHTLIGVAS